MNTIPFRKINGISECIFCGNGPTTKEHIWPSYIREYTRDRLLRFSEYKILTEIKAGLYESSKTNRGNEGLSVTFRILCAECNSNFSGDIQSRAKNALMCAIQGNPIDEKDVKNFQRWLELFAIRSSFETNQGGFLHKDFCHGYRNGSNIGNISVFIAKIENKDIEDRNLGKIGYLRHFKKMSPGDHEGSDLSHTYGYLGLQHVTRIRISNIVGLVIIEHNRSPENITDEQDFFDAKFKATELGLVDLSAASPPEWPTITEQVCYELMASILPNGENHRSLF